MKALLLTAMFLGSSIAMADSIMPATPEQSAAHAAEPMKLVIDSTTQLVPDCNDVVEVKKEGMTVSQVGAIFSSALVGLRLLAEALGFLALQGNASASVGLRVLSYALGMLGWLAGKMGWGTPRAGQVRTMPRYKRKEDLVQAPAVAADKK